MSEPEQYIFEEWDSMCAKANTSLHSDCPLIEDETLVEMHKYVGALREANKAMLQELIECSDELQCLCGHPACKPCWRYGQLVEFIEKMKVEV